MRSTLFLHPHILIVGTLCVDSILDGLCGAFGIHEHDGSLEGPNTLPRPIDVTFRDESGAGDGLRRELFAQVRSVPPE